MSSWKSFLPLLLYIYIHVVNTTFCGKRRRYRCHIHVLLVTDRTKTNVIEEKGHVSFKVERSPIWSQIKKKCILSEFKSVPSNQRGFESFHDTVGGGHHRENGCHQEQHALSLLILVPEVVARRRWWEWRRFQHSLIRQLSDACPGGLQIMATCVPTAIREPAQIIRGVTWHKNILLQCTLWLYEIFMIPPSIFFYILPFFFFFIFLLFSSLPI